MPRATISILLAALMGLHALLGGVRGAEVICLGGGHHHEQSEPVEECHQVCGHDAVRRLVVAEEEHDDRCGCTDVELTVADAWGMLRDGVDDVPAIPVVPVFAQLGERPGEDAMRRGPPPHWEDPGGARRLAVIRSVRLLI